MIRIKYLISSVVAALLLLAAAQGTTYAATLTVTNLNDAGPGSLQQAIAEALPGDTIDFSVAGTITLTSGDLLVSDTLFINGPGAADLTISGNNASRSFNVFGGNLTISGLTISSGESVGAGGGIYLYGGFLTVIDSTVSGNAGSGFGGGIYSYNGEVTLINSVVRDNIAPIKGGGIYLFKSLLAVDNSTISANEATWDGGGIYSYETNSTLSDTVISSNQAGNAGGGIHNSGDSSLNVINSVISGNSAEWGGGIYNFDSGIAMSGSAISHNTASHIGGGIYSYDGVMNLTNSTVNNNDAAAGGGGIVNSTNGTLTVVNSTFSGNTALDASGGAIQSFYATTTVVGTTVSGNSALNAAGFLNYHSELILTNSTVSNNGAAATSGGIANMKSSTLLISNSTVSHNVAAIIGGGVVNSDSRLEMTHTILAGNLAENGPDCHGSLISRGYNLISDSSGCDFESGSGDLVGSVDNPIDPRMGPLQDNGGPNQTRALLPGSLAIDTANCVGLDGKLVTNDQRGFLRPQGAACDIGAFELQVFSTECTLDLNATRTDSAINLDFLLGTPEPANWSALAIAGEKTIPLWSIRISAIEPTVNLATISFLAPPIEIIEFRTSFTTLAGMSCFDSVLVRRVFPTR